MEEIGPDGASVRQGDEFVPCPVIDEPIAVKGGATVVEPRAGDAARPDHRPGRCTTPCKRYRCPPCGCSR
ncbi:MAG: hypothetical protein U0736_07030 [Gemmataceae bacterium]